MVVTPTVSRTDFSQFSLVSIAADEDANAVAVKDVLGGPCRLMALHVENEDKVLLYLKLFDNVNPTLGTTDPDDIFAIPAAAEDDPQIADKGSSRPIAEFPNGKAFKNGLSVGLVTAAGTAGTTGPAEGVTITMIVKPGVS